MVFTLDTHQEDDAEFDKFSPHCVEGSWGQQLVPELKALTEGRESQVHLVEKNRYSGFYQTDLEEYLGLTEGAERERVAEVELVGVCTNICCFLQLKSWPIAMCLLRSMPKAWLVLIRMPIPLPCPK